MRPRGPGQHAKNFHGRMKAMCLGSRSTAGTTLRNYLVAGQERLGPEQRFHCGENAFVQIKTRPNVYY